MLNTLLNSSTIPLLEQTVSFAEARHGVLAGNIANVDTPGYKARDLSTEAFRDRLRSAIKESRPQSSSSTYALNAHLAGLMPQTAAVQTQRATDQTGYDKIRSEMDGMLRHDENNTSLEFQITEIAKNQAQHNLALGIMNQQFRLLRMIVSEHV